jgi:hypothetical protein
VAACACPAALGVEVRCVARTSQTRNWSLFVHEGQEWGSMFELVHLGHNTYGAKIHFVVGMAPSGPIQHSAAICTVLMLSSNYCCSDKEGSNFEDDVLREWRALPYSFGNNLQDLLWSRGGAGGSERQLARERGQQPQITVPQIQAGSTFMMYGALYTCTQFASLRACSFDSFRQVLACATLGHILITSWLDKAGTRQMCMRAHSGLTSDRIACRALSYANIFMLEPCTENRNGSRTCFTAPDMSFADAMTRISSSTRRRPGAFFISPSANC